MQLFPFGIDHLASRVWDGHFPGEPCVPIVNPTPGLALFGLIYPQQIAFQGDEIIRRVQKHPNRLQ
jgi:hypothetical protein